jgi:hypothetical protein
VDQFFLVNQQKGLRAALSAPEHGGGRMDGGQARPRPTRICSTG